MGLDSYLYLTDKETNEMIEFSYYRKFNALQGYFVNEFNIDNPGRVLITEEVLEELFRKVNAIKYNPDKANVLLPVFYGPYYGSYEYDDIYYSYIHRCASDLHHAKYIDFSKYNLYYGADW